MKKVLAVILGLLMMFSLAACGGETIVWDDIILGEMLPEPPAKKGEVHANAVDNLWLNINDLSAKQFNDYIKACKEKGFTVDEEFDSSSYHAYNAEGYELSLSHYGSDADMCIELEAPMEMSVIVWPTSVAGEQLPVPKSTTGKFSYENEDHFYVYVGDTTRADYAEYVAACSEKGFHVDYSKGDDYYYADNREGWHISVRYEGNSIMSIDIDAPSKTDEKSDVTAPTAQPTTEPSSEETVPAATEEKKENNVIDPDFKAAMDGYEKFMDEYVAFMKKFQSNPSDLSLLADYAKYMSSYADFAEDFEKWGDAEMNAAETAYYMEVQARVSKKLLEAAQ